jgi:iron complex outermembrane recepter protein
MSNRKIAHGVRVALMAAGAMGAGLYGATSVAQEQLEEIVVTGSRIASSGLESASPLQIIAAEEIRSTGVANIQDLLLKNPAFGTPTISRTNSNFSTASAGVATVDLRNLGVSRTLVLVDGRRFVAGIPGESAVDLNAIPTQFIERIDILTGGASAVYGSDAVAGVVNIIYKKNFEGIEFDAQYGESSEGDDQTTTLSLTMGTSTADGRGNIMAHIAYADQGVVFSRDRKRSDTDIISRVYFTGDPADVFVAQTPFFSSYAPQGRFFAGADQYTFDQNNNLLTGFSTNGSATRAPDGFNRNGQRTIAIPTERYLFATRGSFEFVEGHSVFMEGTYASSATETDLEPFPLASSDIFAVSGQVPAEFFYEGALRANPIIPTTIFNSMIDEDGDGLRDYYFTRRLTEVGNRGNVADRDTFRIVGGVEGSVFDDWSYEAYYAYGQSKESQVSGGQVNVLNFRNALEAVPDVTDVNGNGNTTEAICRDANARAQGCVPVDLFGFGSISPAAAAYINAPGLLATFTSQKLAGLNITGSVFDMPAGPLGVAFGLEYREEFSRSEFDPLQQAGLNAGNAIPRTEGEFDVSEGYLEVNVPLLNGAPFADRLNLRAAVRASDYSTVGSTTSWNAGFEWSPVSQVRFRAIWAESVRAPNINELFAPPSQTFPTGLVDPCIGVTATSTTAASAVCRADPGVQANIAVNGAFALTQSDIQGVSGFDRGNPDLDEESGESFTVGVVYQPEGIPILENFAFTLDYSKIEISEAIVFTPRQFILDQCYSGANPALCSFVTRRTAFAGPTSAGALEFIDTGPTNSGGLTAEGIDFTVSYSQNVGPGVLSAQLTYAHVLEGYIVPLPGAAKDPFAGEIGGSDDRAYLSLGYAWNDFMVTWRTTYIGSASLDDQFLTSFGFAPGSVGVGSELYNDMQVRWTPGDRYELYFGVNNIFDEEPPPIISGLPGNITGTETDAGTYDAIGRRFYGGFRVKF